MERKDLSLTTPEGKKVYGSPKPPPDIKEQLREQEKREFRQARRLNVVEMPPKDKVYSGSGRSKKAA